MIVEDQVRVPSEEMSDVFFLEARGIGYQVNGVKVLSALSLRLKAGEFLGVVGPNGAGKSSLLKVLSGEKKPSEGSIEVQGVPLGLWKALPLAQIRGVLPQRSFLSFPLSVFEVIFLGRAPYSKVMGCMENRRIVKEVMERVGLMSLAQRDYTTLSGGEQQRVQIARVLAQIWPTPCGKGAPRFLFLDEPTAALDLKYQHGLLQVIRELLGQSIGVLAILHDFALAVRYADRVLMLHEGKKVAEGTPGEVLTPERIGQVFEVDPMLVG